MLLEFLLLFPFLILINLYNINYFKLIIKKTIIYYKKLIIFLQN